MWDGGAGDDARVGDESGDGEERLPQRGVATGDDGGVGGRGGDVGVAGAVHGEVGEGEGGVAQAVAEFVLDGFVEVVEPACG